MKTLREEQTYTFQGIEPNEEGRKSYGEEDHVVLWATEGSEFYIMSSEKTTEGFQ